MSLAPDRGSAVTLRELARRAVFALFGAMVTTVIVALVEAHGSSRALSAAHAPTYAALALADLGVLAPLAALVAVAVAAAAVFFEPDRPRAPQEYLARLRAEPVLTRSRTAALLPLGVVASFAWCLATAHLARAALEQGAPLASGIELAASSMAVLLGLGALVLVLLPGARRLLAAGAARDPRLTDPVTTGGLALAATAIAFVYGVLRGDTGGGGGALEILGVLKRSELDLRPVVNLFAVAMGAYLFPIALSARPSRAPRASAVGAVLALAAALAPLTVTVREARAMNRDPRVARAPPRTAPPAPGARAMNRDPRIARAIEHDAPLGRVALAVLRRATDRDRDGASPYFGGGDCDDRDPRRSPFGVEIPGNGIDEDCSGADLPLPAAVPVVTRPAAGARPRLDPSMNLVLITVDTLRTDLGFMGYDKPVSPNLDALAAESTIFDRAYSMASYTGKSIGPILIGKYPSETDRDGGHFNAYGASNVLLTERLKDAGFRTMGAASHWYFVPWSGLTQGMDTWDTSAMPGSGQGDNDTSVTSAELSDAALRLLGAPENTEGRFFLWLHYFDPHEQYMPHEGVPPEIAAGASTPVEVAKAAYDGEVWFTDQHLGRVFDFIRGQPWGKRTAIVVTSDHGEAFDDHNMNWHGGEIWECLVRVPLLVYVPGLAAHHVPVKRSQVDLVPTLLDVLGVPAPDGDELSGRSMMADLAPVAGASFEERDVYIDMPVGPYTGMRHALIAGATPGTKLYHFGGDQFALFDLEDDPGEKNDLAQSDPDKLREMLGLFLQKRGSVKEVVVAPATR